MEGVVAKCLSMKNTCLHVSKFVKIPGLSLVRGFIQNPRSKVWANNAYASWFYLGISPQTPL
jgi:hypothetical protein